MLRLVVALASLATASAERSALFDGGWKFLRGDVDVSAPSVQCAASAFPLKIGRCEGLRHVAAAQDADACRDACCGKGPGCDTWQWCAKDGSCGMKGQCWIGSAEGCAATDEGWTTAARKASPAPAPHAGPAPAFAKPDFDDSAWRAVELPHDWSIEDLPNREDDLDTPAISIRNGTWKFSKGDDASWSAADFDDSKWAAVTVPVKCGSTVSYGDSNHTGWYRRTFMLTKEKLAAYGKTASPVMLALGEAGCTDATYVNGKHVGGSKGCLAYRAYAIDLSNLKAGENVVAVRVQTTEGKPGGLCDSGALAKNGVSVASGSDWQPPSPFDPARSPNGRSYGE